LVGLDGFPERKLFPLAFVGCVDDLPLATIFSSYRRVVEIGDLDRDDAGGRFVV
jgi:hypothetical protein